MFHTPPPTPPSLSLVGDLKGEGTRVRAAKRIGPHHLDVISVLVGTLLGDCYASKRAVEGTRLVYKQSIIHKDYLF
jgi:hypothetical protein